MSDRANDDQHADQKEPAYLIYEHEATEASDLLVLELHILSSPKKTHHCDTVCDAVVKDERWLAEGDPSFLVSRAQQSQKVAAHNQPPDEVNSDDTEENGWRAHHLTRRSSATAGGSELWCGG